MSFLRKQTYQHLYPIFFLADGVYYESKNKGQTQGKANINQLPFSFLVIDFFFIQERDSYFFVANVYKSGIVQEVIKAIYEKFFVAKKVVRPFIIT
tara:strand:- start:25 stop:312 length:288 start_codon:yes stop_codon:yes gene_type:complete